VESYENDQEHAHGGMAAAVASTVAVATAASQDMTPAMPAVSSAPLMEH